MKDQKTFVNELADYLRRSDVIFIRGQARIGTSYRLMLRFKNHNNQLFKALFYGTQVTDSFHFGLLDRQAYLLKWQRHFQDKLSAPILLG